MYQRHELPTAMAASATLLLLVGCAAAEQTAPPPTSTPTPTAVASPAAVASPTAVPTPTAAPSPTGDGMSPVAVTIGTPASNETLFLPDEASVPTGAHVMLTFENLTNAPHNLVFEPPIDAGTAPVVEPGESDVFDFTAPEPGTYEFVCTLHPWMTGELTVTAAP